MTNEEAAKELMMAYEDLKNMCYMDCGREAAFNKAREALKAEPCEDAVDAIMRILTELGYGDEENGADAEYMSALWDVADKVKELPREAIAALKAEPCGDCVSREFMYKLGAKCIAVRNGNGELVALASIESLPSVTPKITECEDAVSRQAMLDGLASIAKAKAKSDAQKALMGRVMFFTEKLPSVTPQPRTGKWIIHKHDMIEHLECDQCGVFVLHEHLVRNSFCPNCGAKMDGAAEK